MLISKSTIFLTYLDINENKVTNIELNQSKQKNNENLKEFEKILNQKTILLGFNSNSFEAPLLNYILKNKNYNINKYIKYCETIKSKEKNGIADLLKKVYRFIDMRKMCKSKINLSLNDIACQLNYIKLIEDYPNNLISYGIKHETVIDNLFHSVKILKELYLNLFDYEKLIGYNAYLKVLKESENFQPTFNTILDAFTASPQKKWTNLYSLALNLKSQNEIKSKELNNEMILNLIRELE
jgi:hypothetical protein